MSFEPFPVWIPRCDGDTTHGQCTTRLYLTVDEDGDTVPDHDDAEQRHPVLYTRPASDQAAREDLQACGWLALPGDRFLCPRHVAELEYLARAEIDGLPLPAAGVSDPVPGVDDRPHDWPWGAS